MTRLRRIITRLGAVSLLVCAAVTAQAGHEVSLQEAGLREQAEKGDAGAMNYLGYLLVTGTDSVAQDIGEGLVWLTRAASAGDVKAASNLGWLYLQGDILEQDLEQSVAWFLKAAEAGLPVARSVLGDLYRDGKGVGQDSLKADSLYREAFEGGLADAGYKLYDLNSSAYEKMTPEEMVETGKYYYLRGAPSQGVKLFYAAADSGNADALALLGDAYTRASGVPYDYDLSLKYYAKAAVKGNPSAQFVLGELLEIFPDALSKLEEGDFPEGISDDASYWYSAASAGGVSDAETAARLLLAPR